MYIYSSVSNYTYFQLCCRHPQLHHIPRELQSWPHWDTQSSANHCSPALFDCQAQLILLPLYVFHGMWNRLFKGANIFLGIIIFIYIHLLQILIIATILFHMYLETATLKCCHEYRNCKKLYYVHLEVSPTTVRTSWVKHYKSVYRANSTGTHNNDYAKCSVSSSTLRIE